jgi:sec-independent protein translocase protein TatB
MFPEGRALEFLIAAIVALIVVGPKDLPILLRKFGQFMAKVRSMAAEVRASFDEMARQSELDELRKEVEAMRKGQLADMATHAPEVNQAFDEISQGLSDVGVQLNAPVRAFDTQAQTATIEIETPAQTAKRKAAAVKKPAAKKAAAKKPAAKKGAATKSAPPKTAPKKVAAPKVPTVEGAPKAKAPAKPRARKATVS